MNTDLRRLVHDRLSSEGLLQENWSALVLATCDGGDALAGVLQNTKAAVKPADKATTTSGADAYPKKGKGESIRDVDNLLKHVLGSWKNGVAPRTCRMNLEECS